MAQTTDVAIDTNAVDMPPVEVVCQDDLASPGTDTDPGSLVHQETTIIVYLTHSQPGLTMLTMIRLAKNAAMRKTVLLKPKRNTQEPTVNPRPLSIRMRTNQELTATKVGNQPLQAPALEPFLSCACLSIYVFASMTSWQPCRYIDHPLGQVPSGFTILRLQ